jgi:hypothetical protein
MASYIQDPVADLADYGFGFEQSIQTRLIYNQEAAVPLTIRADSSNLDIQSAGNTVFAATGNETHSSVDLTYTVTGNELHTVTGMATLAATGNATISGANANLTGATNANITATAGDVVMGATAGNLDLDAGAAVTIDATTTSAITAGTSHTLAAASVVDNITGLYDMNVGSLTADSTGSMALQSNTTMNLGSTGAFTVDATGNLDVDSSAGTVNVGTTNDAGTVNIGTGANRTVNVGSSTAALGLLGSAVTMGDAAGTVTVLNDLTVNGDLNVVGGSTSLDVLSLAIDDKVITLHDITTPTDALADEGGVILKGTSDKTILYQNAFTAGAQLTGPDGAWEFNQHMNLQSTLGLYIDNQPVLGANYLAVDCEETVTNGGMYLDGPATITAPVDGNIRIVTLDRAGGNRRAIEIQYYNNLAWNTLRRFVTPSLV